MIKWFHPIFVATALAMLLTGCVNGAKYSEMANSLPTLKADEGRIYFYRSSAYMGAGIQPEIRLNGTVVGKSKAGGFFYVDRQAGQYVVACSTEAEKTVSFSLDAGETKYVRTALSPGILVMRVSPTLVAATLAHKELPSLGFTGEMARVK